MSSLNKFENYIILQFSSCRLAALYHAFSISIVMLHVIVRGVTNFFEIRIDSPFGELVDRFQNSSSSESGRNIYNMEPFYNLLETPLLA